MTNFAPAFRKTMGAFLFGALDEWLSQRSAKPSTAVRIRQAPLKKERELKKESIAVLSFLFSRKSYYASLSKRLLISAISSSSNHLESRFLAWSMMAGSISVHTFFST